MLWFVHKTSIKRFSRVVHNSQELQFNDFLFLISEMSSEFFQRFRTTAINESHNWLKNYFLPRAIIRLIIMRVPYKDTLLLSSLHATALFKHWKSRYRFISEARNVHADVRELLRQLMNALFACQQSKPFKDGYSK